MQRNDILNELQGVFRATFDDPELLISDDMTAADYEAWDSLSHIQLIIATEAQFKLRFSNAEIARLNDVGDLISLISSKSA